MFPKFILSALAASATVFANAIPQGASTTTTTVPAYIGPATTATNLPAATYRAIFPGNNPNPAILPPVAGNFTLTSSPDHPGVHITFHLSHLPAPALYGPFAYHIHTDPVPANGNCSAAGKHLDPTSAGDATPCDAREPETCQVGDLSGKYGNVTAGAGDGEFVHVVYRDAFLSTDAASAAFVGGRSVVVHLNNGTRFACANLVKCEGGAGGGNGTVGGAGNATMGTGHGGTTTTTTMPSSMSPVATAESTGASEGAPVQTDGAGALTVGGWMVAAGLVGMVL